MRSRLRAKVRRRSREMGASPRCCTISIGRFTRSAGPSDEGRAYPCRARRGEDIRRAILSHADYSGVPRVSRLEKTLFACDELAGFLTACSYVKPGRSIHEVEVKAVRKKLKDKAFARNVNRDDIAKGAAEMNRSRSAHRILHRGYEGARRGAGLGRRRASKCNCWRLALLASLRPARCEEDQRHRDFLRGFARILLAGAVSNGFEWLYVASSCRRSGAVTMPCWRFTFWSPVTGNCGERQTRCPQNRRKVIHNRSRCRRNRFRPLSDCSTID